MSGLDVVAGLINRDGLYLACRNAPGRRHAGYWEFPGGRVEQNESLEDALVRELKEELSIAAKVGPKLGSVELKPPVHGTIHFFLVEVIGDLPRVSSDHDELAWLTLENIRNLALAEADSDFLELFRGELR